MQKVAVVILNYLNYWDTIECVESLKKQNYNNYETIIVENGSNNESYEILKEKYSNLNNIHIVKSAENLGFAKGNNLGIVYARENLECNFILVVNNDTIFCDLNLIKTLMNNYRIGDAIIGPRIVLKDGAEQNPMDIPNTKIQIVKNLFVEYLRVFNMGKFALFLMKVKRKIKKPNGLHFQVPNNQEGINLILNGACFMLTPDYFDYFPYLFPKTFLYVEENILTLITSKVNLNKKFINDAQIYHKEDQSSEVSFLNNSKIMARYSIESLNYCYQLFNLSYREILENYFIN